MKAEKIAGDENATNFAQTRSREEKKRKAATGKELKKEENGGKRANTETNSVTEKKIHLNKEVGPYGN